LQRDTSSIRSFVRNHLSAVAFVGVALAVALGAILVLTSTQPSLGAAAGGPVKGAAALPQQPVPQESADGVRPSPADASADRGPIVSDGCMVGKTGTHSSKCLYGDRKGKWTLVLFGDSHAMQYFDPLELLAKAHHWRLLVLNKRECTPGEVTIRNTATGLKYRQCDVWRRREMRRIERLGRQATVVISGDTAYTADRHGHALAGKANAAAMEAGYIATLSRIRRAGLGTIVIKDMPESPRSIPACVEKNPQHLRACAFHRSHDANREFDARATAAVPGTSLIDLTPEVCPHDLCRAVIGDALVFRDKAHLTATFARTLSPWIASGLREAGVPQDGTTGS
jgi:hypothetical protein